VLLVVDGSTGQNAISQAREFNESVKLTGLVVTKLDGTPKGGIVIAIKDELGIPVRYIGVGESQHDIRPFAPREFTDALFDPAGTEGGGGDVPLSAHGEVRRRRRRVSQPIV
jgi:fused signal recognition particle receptor